MRELADLQAAKAAGDEDSAAASILGIANIDAAKRNLAQLTSEYAGSLNPPAPPPQSREEWQAKPVERMTPADGLEVVRSGSKYGRNLDFNDPNVVAGWHEAQRRRQRGL